MSDLIERLEALTGPCRECDGLIAAAVGAKHGPDGGWSNNHNGDYWAVKECAKPYTASIDAAMTLAEGVRCRLIIAEDGISDVLVDGTQGCGHNTAIAICIAALKATP